MKISAIILSTVLASAVPGVAFAQGANAGTTGGAAGSVGGTQAGRPTAPGGSNGDASTPAPSGTPGMNGQPAPASNPAQPANR